MLCGGFQCALGRLRSGSPQGPAPATLLPAVPREETQAGEERDLRRPGAPNPSAALPRLLPAARLGPARSNPLPIRAAPSERFGKPAEKPGETNSRASFMATALRDLGRGIRRKQNRSRGPLEAVDPHLPTQNHLPLAPRSPAHKLRSSASQVGFRDGEATDPKVPSPR